MSIAELLPAARMLSRAEKLRLIQLLAEDLAGSEQLPMLEAGQTYPVWSPHDAFEAAEVLMQLLEKERAKT